MLIKRTYTDQETIITAENMNDIQDAIIALEDGLFTVENNRSGEIIAMTDAANRGFRRLNIYGRTTQDGVPTPDAPVDLVSAGDGGSINITVAGKNIFEFVGKAQMENGSIINSTPTGGTFQGNPGDTPGSSLWTSGWAHFERTSALHLKAGTIITISADYTVLEKHPSAYGKATIILDALAGETSLDIKTAEAGVKYRISRTVMIPKDGKYKKTTFTTHSSKVQVENVQWEIGGVASDFVPYKEQTLTISTPNGLPGIPVTSGGNYTDSKGQQWICDEIDLARGVYVQRVCEYITPIFGSNGTASEGVYLYSTFIPNAQNVLNTKTLSTHFKWMESGALAQMLVGQMIVRDRTDYPVVYCASTISGESEFNTWVQENNVRFLSIRATPIETPLSAEELAAYSALHTYRNHTTVSNDAGAYMELEYVMDAKKYIDSLITGGIAPATVE